VEREQLRDRGYSDEAIEHRIARGRLHRVRPRVYAVGRPVDSRKAEWMAADESPHARRRRAKLGIDPGDA